MGTSYVAKEVPEPRMHLGREDVGRTNLFSHQKSGTAPVVRRPFFVMLNNIFNNITLKM